MVAAGLLAAGCGGDDDDDAADDSGSTDETTAEASDESAGEETTAEESGEETTAADTAAGDTASEGTTAEEASGEDPAEGSSDAPFDFAGDWPEDRLCGLLEVSEAADILGIDEADVTLTYNDAFIDLGVQCHYASPEFDEIIVEVNAFTWEETMAIAEGLGDTGGEVSEVAGHDAVVQENDIIGALISLDIGADQPTMAVSAPALDQATAAAELVLGRL
jgi:hypothetical protein